MGWVNSYEMVGIRWMEGSTTFKLLSSEKIGIYIYIYNERQAPDQITNTWKRQFATKERPTY
jgi:hypothetical protein